MKKAALILLVLLTLKSAAESTVRSHQHTSLFRQRSDLNFLPSEVNSMLASTGNCEEVYKPMHAVAMINQLTFPYTSDPAPITYTTNTKQHRFEFPIIKTNVWAYRRDQLTSI